MRKDTDYCVAYVTKWAIDEGIWKGKTLITDIGHNKLYVKFEDSMFSDYFTKGETVFLTKEEALAEAEKMLTARIAALEKQIAQLKAFRFSFYEH